MTCHDGAMCWTEFFGFAAQFPDEDAAKLALAGYGRYVSEGSVVKASCVFTGVSAGANAGHGERAQKVQREVVRPVGLVKAMAGFRGSCGGRYNGWIAGKSAGKENHGQFAQTQTLRACKG